ncbi:MAG: hypothetical protein PHE12_05000 [Clostridia bacterium]|nr:hypothetical protein [Clostridia bacterium]
MKPYTENDDNYITDLSVSDMETVLNWIKENIYPRKTPLYGCSSYSLKHIMTKATGIYVTNNQFKDAMLRCNFIPINGKELNWHYGISKKSPCFKNHYVRKPYCNEIMPNVNGNISATRQHN